MCMLHAYDMHLISHRVTLVNIPGLAVNTIKTNYEHQRKFSGIYAVYAGLEIEIQIECNVVSPTS